MTTAAKSPLQWWQIAIISGLVGAGGGGGLTSFAAPSESSLKETVRVTVREELERWSVLEAERRARLEDRIGRLEAGVYIP